MPATIVAIVPYLVATVYLNTFVRYSDFVTFSHIAEASYLIRFLSEGTAFFSACIVRKNPDACYYSIFNGCRNIP